MGITVKGYLTRETINGEHVERHYAVTDDGRHFCSEQTFRVPYSKFGNGDWKQITREEFDNASGEYIGNYSGVGIEEIRRCAYGCGMPAAPGDRYCADCATAPR